MARRAHQFACQLLSLEPERKPKFVILRAQPGGHLLEVYNITLKTSEFVFSTTEVNVSEVTGPRPGTSCILIVHPENRTEHLLLAPVGVVKNMLKMIKATTVVAEVADPSKGSMHCTTMNSGSEGEVQYLPRTVPAPPRIDEELGHPPSTCAETCNKANAVSEKSQLNVPQISQEQGFGSIQSAVTNVHEKNELIVEGPTEQLSNKPGDEFGSHALLPTPAGRISNPVVDTPMPILASLSKEDITTEQQESSTVDLTLPSELVNQDPHSPSPQDAKPARVERKSACPARINSSTNEVQTPETGHAVGVPIASPGVTSGVKMNVEALVRAFDKVADPPLSPMLRANKTNAQGGLVGAGMAGDVSALPGSLEDSATATCASSQAGAMGVEEVVEQTDSPLPPQELLHVLVSSCTKSEVGHRLEVDGRRPLPELPSLRTSQSSVLHGAVKGSQEPASREIVAQSQREGVGSVPQGAASAKAVFGNAELNTACGAEGPRGAACEAAHSPGPATRHVVQLEMESVRSELCQFQAEAMHLRTSENQLEKESERVRDELFSKAKELQHRRKPHALLPESCDVPDPRASLLASDDDAVDQLMKQVHHLLSEKSQLNQEKELVERHAVDLEERLEFLESVQGEVIATVQGKLHSLEDQLRAKQRECVSLQQELQLSGARGGHVHLMQDENSDAANMGGSALPHKCEFACSRAEHFSRDQMDPDLLLRKATSDPSLEHQDELEPESDPNRALPIKCANRAVPNKVDITGEGKTSGSGASSAKESPDTGGCNSKTPDHLKPPPQPHLILCVLYFVGKRFCSMLELIVGMMKTICLELMATLTVGSWTSRIVEISEQYAQSPEGPTPRQSMDTYAHIQEAVKPANDSEDESETFSQDLPGDHRTSCTSTPVADQRHMQFKNQAIKLHANMGITRPSIDKPPDSRDGHTKRCSGSQREEYEQRTLSGVGSGPSTHGLIRRRDRVPNGRSPLTTQP